MRIREYIAALGADWLVLMSGIASVVLAFWAAFFPPANVQAGRTLLFVAAVACFAVASYRIWAKERDAREKDIDGLLKAHRKQLSEDNARHETEISAKLNNIMSLEAELAKTQSQLEELTKHKLIFEIDERASRIHLQEFTEKRPTVIAKIKLLFENKDVHPWSMKSLDLTLHDLQGRDEIYTWIRTSYSSNGVGIEKEQFEGMLMQGGRVSPFYLFEAFMSISDEKIQKSSDLNGKYFLRITMEASNQPPLTSDMFLSWEDALKDGGSPLIFTFGTPSISVLNHRMK